MWFLSLSLARDLGSVVKLNSEKRDGANKECGDKGTNIFEVP
jgi:hypothetical protein